MKVSERFINYAKIYTTSDPDSTTRPSAMREWDLARYLEKEMKEMGVSEVTVSDDCVVYGTIPGNCEGPAIGFIAHMDTAPEMNGENVHPRIISNYQGETIVLNEELGISMSPEAYPSLLTNIGEDLIVTDGTSLLGGDDKAGIAAAMQMAQYYLDHPEIPHAAIKIAFTPDEEVGRGTEGFDVPFFNAEFAYTIDGGEEDHIDFENFNAASAKVIIHGKEIHPGSAKGKMINAALVAMEFNALLPVFDNPAYTEGYEGFNHLGMISGNVESAKMYYIIRNHNADLLAKQKGDFENARDFLNRKYGYAIVDLEIEDSYSNMRSYIEKDMRCVEIARKAMVNIGMNPISSAIRGGTDGAWLTYNGLNCPNLGTGGYNCHGKYEYVSINRLEKVVALLIEIVKCAVE